MPAKCPNCGPYLRCLGCAKKLRVKRQAKLDAAELGSEPVNPSGLGAEMDDLMEFEPPSDKAYGVPPPAYAIGDVVAVRETIRLVTPKGNYLYCHWPMQKCDDPDCTSDRAIAEESAVFAALADLNAGER